jgi:hypothetical protein
MAKAKKHIWKKIRGVPGVYSCARCHMKKYIGKGHAPMYARDGVVDNSPTKHNCFILSKD